MLPATLDAKCLSVPRTEIEVPGQLRVLHLLPSLRPDGAERIATYIASGVDKRRYQAAVVSISEPVGSELEGALQNAGVQVWYLGKKGTGFDARMYPRIQQVFRAFGPEVLHTHLDVLRYAVPTVVYYKPRSMVHTVHNIAKYEMEWYGRVLQHLAYRCGMVPVAVSCEVARSVERKVKMMNSPIVQH